MPPIDIDVVEIRHFAGDHQGMGVLALPDIYSPDGSQNVYVDKTGRLKTISGYTKQNSSAKTTDTGASAAIFRSLFPYRVTVAGTTTRQLLGILDDGVNEWEFWKSTDNGVNWTFVSDRGATPVGQIPDWAISGQFVYLTVPKTEIPRVWDGTTLAAAGSTQIAAPTLSDGGAGVLSGSYQFKIVPVLASSGLEKQGSVTSAVLQVQDKQINVAWTADADTLVGGYNIYRTTATGKILYFETYSNDRTVVAYTSNTPDLTLIQGQSLTWHGDAPPSGVYFCERFKQRIWWGRTDAFPRRAYYADVGEPDSVNTDNSYVDATDGDSLGDVLTGMTGDYQSSMVMWLERSVWTVTGTGQVLGTIIDWNLRRSSASMGAVHHRTVLRIPQGAKWTDTEGEIKTIDQSVLAYLTPLGDIRIFDGQHDEVISYAKSDDLAMMNYANRAKSHACIDTVLKLAMWWIPTSGSEPDRCVAWDFGRGTWHTFTPMPMASVIEMETSSAAQLLLGSEASTAKGGLVYALKSGTTFDGTAITYAWMTKALYPRGSSPNAPASLAVSGLGEDLVRVKRFRFAMPLFTANGSPATITIGVYTPFAVAADSPVFTLSSTGTKLGRLNLQDATTGRFFHHHGARMKFSGTSAFVLEGIGLGFQVLPGLRRTPLP